MNLLRRCFLFAVPVTFWSRGDEAEEKPWSSVLDSLENPKFRAIEVSRDHVVNNSDGIDGTTLGWRINDFTKVSLDEKTMEKALQFKSNEVFFRDLVDLCRSEKRPLSFAAVILLNCVYPEWRFEVKIDPLTINTFIFIRLHVMSTTGENPQILNISQKTFGSIAADHWTSLQKFGMIELRKKRPSR